MLLRAVLLLTAAVSVFGQQALKDALGLTEMQIWRLRQDKRAAVAPNGVAAIGIPYRMFVEMRPYKEWLNEALLNPILDASQQAKLAEIVKVLDRWAAASEAIVAGLIDVQQWPGSTLCFYPIRVYASEFGLSDSQVQQLDRLRQAAREPLEARIAEKEKERSGLSESTVVRQSIADISKLQQQLAATGPPRGLALTVLDYVQRTQVAAFETALELVREAIAIKLIPDPPKGEPLCM